MLTPASWLPQAQATEEGRRRRVDHDCGPGRTLLVNHEPTKWTAYCFRCSDSGWEAKPAESLSERIARRARQQAQDDALRAAPTLPLPKNYDVASWPPAAALWLYKAGMGRPEIADLGAYYHEPSGRVVLPVMRGGRTVYWSARSVDGRQPKYLNASVDRTDLVAEYGSGEVLVLTEDILSAYRVGQVTEAWSLLGTSMNDRIATRILRRGGPVAVWLDPDWSRPPGKRPGVIAGRRITRSLQLLGIDARFIRSRADPKNLSQREIRQCLPIPTSCGPPSRSSPASPDSSQG